MLFLPGLLIPAGISLAGKLFGGKKKPASTPAAAPAPNNNIYLGNPELQSAIERSGKVGGAAEDDFLARARGFDPRQGLNDYATGATNQFLDRLGEAWGHQQDQELERGAFSTGFKGERKYELTSNLARDFQDQLAMKALDAQQQGLQNTNMLGQYAQNKSDTYLDALSGLTTSKYQQDQLNASSKREQKGNLIGAGINAVGSFLGSPTGGKVLSFAGNALKGIFSDEEAKEGVEGLRSALDKLKQLEGVLFEYNSQAQGMGAPPGQQAGVIAQDVEQVMPGAVGEAGGMKTVDYTAVTGLLTEAVKELEARLAGLESKMGGEEQQEGAIPTPEMAASQMRPPGMEQMMPPGMAMSDKKAKTKIRKMVRK